MIRRANGELVTTYAARGWPRCQCCRKPYEANDLTAHNCPSCHFSKVIPPEEFWSWKDHPLFPYNIGAACHASMVAERETNQ